MHAHVEATKQRYRQKQHSAQDKDKDYCLVTIYVARYSYIQVYNNNEAKF